jgi:hypothetical protein
MRDIHRWGAVAASVLLLRCGSSTSSSGGNGAGETGGTGDAAGAVGSGTLLLSEQQDASISGHFASRGRELEFSARRTAPLAGVVQVRVGALSYDVQYDYEQGVVRADGHGGALDRPALHALRAAIDSLRAQLAPGEPGSALHEQMLTASLSLLHDSGGMSLDSQTFDLGTAQRPVGAEMGAEQPLVEKSLDDDGVRCIQHGEWYPVSFDYGEALVLDADVQAGSKDCNGQCGPACAQLTPWRMWTLDCLEHDTCCAATDGDTECWTPLGECGDEYEAAMKDFLRGVDPLRKHCGG